MIRTRIAHATAVVALVLATAALLPSAAVAAEPAPSSAPVVVADSAVEPLSQETGTWGG
ncbi:hypothetical protein OG209_21925 [Streptomyces sp. NBC_01383]|uniref:hypothetical protein n=1 Tax=Streptomyces sp. NBC_01383 TaxID=2903846 RepID=UPI00325183A5